MSDAENRACQSCQTEFIIEPEDFAFYDKIQVPPPTWCPDCRAQRRFAWRNERYLFRKPDALTGEPIFSSFSPQSAVNVYPGERWRSDQWDPMEYGREYDFSRPFFAQMRELLAEVPLQARSILNPENSDFAFNAIGIKNCYLVAVAAETEDSAYLVSDNRSRNCFDCHMTSQCELSYDGLNLHNCYQTFYSSDCEGCRNVILSRNLIGCSDCFGCVNLRGKQYYIFNQPYSKEEYARKIAEFRIDSYEQLQVMRAQAEDFIRSQPNPHQEERNTQSSSGDYLHNTKNVQQSYRCRDIEDAKYCQDALSGPSRECYDCTVLAHGAELTYETIVNVKGVYDLKFCFHCREGARNVQYSFFCDSSTDLFGCVSLYKKQYCIFNKQYTQAEYEALVPRIIQHMKDMPYTDKLGRVYSYGEFFPPELSPVEYNVSLAQEHFPLSKQEALAQGYNWYEQPMRTTAPDLLADELPDLSTDVSADLVGKVIACQHGGKCTEECTGAFTIISQELAFLMEQGLPLPRLCFNCRHASRIKRRRRMKLYNRQCQCAGGQSSNGVYHNIAGHPSHAQDQPCPNEFETSFAPDRPEIVYCESCYQGEVV